MQGKTTYQEKLFTEFLLSERVPEHNFYRQLKSVLDLSYLYKLTEPFYGVTGQKSIDPVVKPITVPLPRMHALVLNQEKLESLIT